jgi:hypothetical protein
LSN